MSKITATWIADASYAVPLSISIATFQKWSNFPCEVICSSCDVHILSFVLQKVGVHANIKAIKPPNVLTADIDVKTVANRYARMSVLESTPPNQVRVLIDADTLFAADISEFMNQLYEEPVPNKADVWAVVEHEFVSKGYFYFHSKRNGYARLDSADSRRCYQAVFGSLAPRLEGSPQPNNGVIAFRNAAELCRAWKYYYTKGLECCFVNEGDDQVPLVGAMLRQSSTFTRLADRFNSLGKVNGDYAIFHANDGTWRSELFSAVMCKKALSDYARLAQPILRRLPPRLMRELRFR